MASRYCTEPWSLLPQLVGHVVDLVEEGGGARVGTPHLALLLLRQRHRAQAQQLVDLERVEERRLALRRQLRVVVEDDRRAQHHAGLVVRPRQHREDAVVLARRHESLRPLRRVEQGHERRAVDLEQHVAGDQRAAQPLRPVGRRHPASCGAVLDGQGQQGDGVRRHRPLDRGGHAHGERSRRAPAGRRGRPRPRRPPAPTGRRSCPRRAGRRARARPRPPRPRARRRCPRRPACSTRPAVVVLDRPVLHVQEPDGGPQRGGVAVDDDGRPAPRPLGLVESHGVGRHQHAPLPAHLVLRRARAVRVEHVPLVEHGVRDRAGLRRARASRVRLARAAAPPPRPSRPARACPRYAARSSYADRLRRSHAWPGKCASIASRQTATGIRTWVSLCHGTGCTDNDPSAPLNTVPLNSRISGTSPSSSAARYLWAATSTSYDSGSTRSKSQVPVKRRQDLRQERQLHRLHGAAPARAVAEQVDHLGRLAVAVGPAHRLDPHLAAQRDRVDPLAAGLGRAHLRHDRRAGGVAVGDDVEAGEVEVDTRQGGLRHADLDTGSARSSSAPKNSPIVRHTSAPPPRPVQESRTSPTSS